MHSISNISCNLKFTLFSEIRIFCTEKYNREQNSKLHLTMNEMIDLLSINCVYVWKINPSNKKQDNHFR